MNFRSRGAGVAVWILTFWETATMGLAAFAKFARPKLWQGFFVGWGYPAGFTNVVGGLEMAGAVLLLVPPAAPYAAGLLIAIMLGALATLLTHTNTLGVGAPILHIVLLVLIGVMRWKRQRGAGPSSLP